MLYNKKFFLQINNFFLFYFENVNNFLITVTVLLVKINIHRHIVHFENQEKRIFLEM